MAFFTVGRVRRNKNNFIFGPRDILTHDKIKSDSFTFNKFLLSLFSCPYIEKTGKLTVENQYVHFVPTHVSQA